MDAGCTAWTRPDGHLCRPADEIVPRRRCFSTTPTSAVRAPYSPGCATTWQWGHRLRHARGRCSGAMLQSQDFTREGEEHLRGRATLRAAAGHVRGGAGRPAVGLRAVGWVRSQGQPWHGHSADLAHRLHDPVSSKRSTVSAARSPRSVWRARERGPPSTRRWSRHSSLSPPAGISGRDWNKSRCGEP